MKTIFQLMTMTALIGILSVKAFAFDVEKGSLAWQAGFRSGDKVTELDGGEVLDSDKALESIENSTPGSESYAIVVRDGHRGLIHFSVIDADSLEPGPGIGVLRIQDGVYRVLVHDEKALKDAVLNTIEEPVYSVRKQGAKKLPLLITELPDAWPGKVLDIRVGDSISRINGEIVHTDGDLALHTNAALDNGGPIRLDTMRAGKQITHVFMLTPAGTGGDESSAVKWVAILAEVKGGVEMVRADPGSPYAELGLTSGIVVDRAGRKSVDKVEDLNLLNLSLDEARRAGFHVKRGGFRLGIPGK